MTDETFGPVSEAVAGTLEHLRAEGLLGPEHAGLVGLVRACARDLDSEDRLSVAKSTTSRLLADLLARLPAPAVQESGVWEDLVAQMDALDAGTAR